MTPSTRALNRHAVFSRIGSFWTQSLEPVSKKVARSMTHLVDASAAAHQVNEAVRQLAGHSVVRSGNLDVRFKETGVGVIGPDLQERIVTRYGDNGVPVWVTRRPTEYDLGWKGHFPAILEESTSKFLAATEDCDFLLFPDPEIEVALNINPDDLRPLYMVAIPYDVTPLSIVVADRELVLGADFYAGQGVIVFREHPLELFPTGYIFVRGYERRQTNVLNYTLQVDEFEGPADDIATFQREKSNPTALLRAVAAATGLACPKEDCVVQKVFARCTGADYLTSAGMLRAPYKHTLLTEGTSLAKDTVVGGGLRLHWNRYGQPSWYRSVDWSEGLPLGYLSPVEGITIPDAPCKAWAYAQTGSKLHVRFDLPGDAGALDRFWRHVKESEIRTGFYLNDALNLNALNDFVILNPLDFYFTHLLGERGVVAELRLREVGEHFRLRALAFLQTDRFLNSLLIIRDL